MINTETMSQIEMNKVVIQRYFEAYNNKNEAIFDEIIAPEYVDHGQFMLALKSTERFATIIIQNEIEAIRGLIEQRSKDGEAICTICILVMFDVMFIVIFKLRSYILSLYTMCFY
jgi:hypothetical protein